MTIIREGLVPVEGMSVGVGFYLAAMEEVRAQLREAVGALSVEEIGRCAVSGAHSIGALVLHIGESEWWWMRCVIEGHELTPEDRAQVYWDVLLDPEGFARRGLSAQYCLDVIDELRAETRRLLAARTDEDLERLYTSHNEKRTLEVSLRWVLHHLIDHEAQHKGQILMLKRLQKERLTPHV